MRFVLIITISLCFVLKVYSQSQMEVFSLNRDSAIFYTNGEKSLPYSFELLRLANEMGSDSCKAVAFQELAFDYRNLASFSNALKYAYKAAEIYEKYEQSGSLGMMYNVIGTIYLHLTNYKKAQEFFYKSIQAHKNYHYKPLLVDDYSNLGEAYRLTQQYDSALNQFSKAHQLGESIEVDSSRMALVHCNLGLTYHALNKNNLSDSLLNLAFEYYKKQNEFYPICVSFYELAKSSFESGLVNKAQQHALQALQLALDNQYNKEERDVYQLLSKIAQHEKEYFKAFNYLHKYQQLKDSLVNEKVISQMGELRIEFEVEQKQKEVDFFKTLSKTRTNLALALTFGLSIIVILLLFLFRANQKRKAANALLIEQNHELDQKNHIINESLIEKEMLMKEIHHRVKNNLQIISSIISLQRMRISNEEVSQIFDEMQRRILAISSIHQKLYQSESVSTISMKDYLEEVVDSIHMAFNNDSLNATYEIAIQNVKLNIDAAVSLGLITNELTTNAYKYAFKPNNNNQILVSLRKLPGETILIIRDNGPGMEEGVDIANSDSLGLRMVTLLTRQLKGKMEIKNDHGLLFHFTFPKL